jgi:hypothetical protein
MWQGDADKKVGATSQGRVHREKDEHNHTPIGERKRSASASPSRLLWHWSRTEGLLLLGHLCLKGLSGLLPGRLRQWHFTRTLSLAGVLSWIGTAPSLAFAGILSVASVGLGRGACPLSCTGIVLALPLALAGIDTPADMGLAEDIGGIILLFIICTNV